jgi:hypothetical protein
MHYVLSTGEDNNRNSVHLVVFHTDIKIRAQCLSLVYLSLQLRAKTKTVRVQIIWHEVPAVWDKMVLNAIRELCLNTRR